MFEETAFLARARSGSGRTQAAAAATVGLSRATLCAYETARVQPSERTTWRLVGRLALGEPVDGERPSLLVSFALFGQRFVAWRDGLLVLTEIDHAQRLADALVACRLERVVIVPCWPSKLKELIRDLRLEHANLDPVVFDSSGADFPELARDVIGSIAAAAPNWMAMHLSVEQEDGTRT
jgi:DNA-binding XRE family transcriptional regulator